jgi:hypothetical protein
MLEMPANSVDFILTDPPYLVNYRDRSGRTIQNDVDETWLKPAMAEAYRVIPTFDPARNTRQHSRDFAVRDRRAKGDTSKPKGGFVIGLLREGDDVTV